VLSVGGRIVGGAAQHLTATALLHQGTISTELDRAAIDRLFGFCPPSPSDRLGSLRELGLKDPPDRLALGLAAAIARDLAAG
jgi:lipoate-protein ligase A